eukprot:GFUD01030300.1.p1 GENE.GFUD01030300.1~~GFUD01030300.1.p1  ORF type:complete len:233 (-),score=82.50 GFUD01030300.1:125-823(-)
MEFNEECNSSVAGQDGGFMKSSSTYSIDNESGYEDTISDANDTLNDSIEQESRDTGCVDTISTNIKNKSSLAEESFDITKGDTGEDGRDSADTLVDDMSLLSLEFNTRPSSSSSFSSSYISTGSGRRTSRIPVRTRSASSKKEEKGAEECLTRDQMNGSAETSIRSVKNQAAADRKGKPRRRAKKKECVRQVELWEIQQSLGRGEYVEGILSVGGGQASLLYARDGRLEWRF